MKVATDKSWKFFKACRIKVSKCFIKSLIDLAEKHAETTEVYPNIKNLTSDNLFFDEAHFQQCIMQQPSALSGLSPQTFCLKKFLTFLEIKFSIPKLKKLLYFFKRTFSGISGWKVRSLKNRNSLYFLKKGFYV